MSDQLIRVVTAVVLLLHGLGHGGALGALAWIALRPSDSTGAWSAARSWLAPGLASGTATYLASAFWIVSLIGFLAATAGFWFQLGDWWRVVAIGSALVSTVGILTFAGTWPAFNAVAAILVNVAVLVGLGMMGWVPPKA